MRHGRLLGIVGTIAFVMICILLAESTGTPTQGVLNTNMCVQSSCHTTFPLNQNPNLLSVTGFPSPTYTPGQSYDITVTVSKNPNVSSGAVAGFAAFVNKDGTPLTASVGTISITDSGTHLMSANTGPAGNIVYVTHSLPKPDPSTATFTFRWTAPSTTTSNAVLVVGSNSANGDTQNTGDFITKKTFTATPGQSCSYSISPTSQAFSAAGGTGSITMTTATGCAWTASTNASFITFTSASTGSGNGTVSFSVAANTSTATRSGTITVAGQTFTVTQAAALPENEKQNFADFANGNLGGGNTFSSTLILMNPSSTQDSSGTARLFDSNGNNLNVNINGTPANGQFTFDVPPQGIRFFSTDGTGALQVGSVQLSSTLPLGATILFVSPVGTTGVPGVQPLAHFMVPIEYDLSDLTKAVKTGVAVSNSTTNPVTVTVNLRDTEGKIVPNGTTTIQLQPNGQLARFPDEIYQGKGIDFTRFKGTLEIVSAVPVNGMAIRTSPGQFTTEPVAEVK